MKARLLLGTRADALVIPATALQRGPTGTFVYVIGKDDTVAVRPVRADPPLGQVAIVEEGLAEGERVVADGQGQLRPGAKVAPRDRPAEPAASPGETRPR